MTTRAPTPDWVSSEWSDSVGAMDGWLNGIEASVIPEVENGQQTGRWEWWVKPTSKRCEWPELYDMGTTATSAGAVRAATASMRKADRGYPVINYG